MAYLRVNSLARLFAAALLCGGCGPSGGDMAEGDGGVPEQPDEDGDGIADVDEGKSDGTDTDGDGTPDYLDEDSDGDGIPDAVEAGDEDLGTSPFDSDGDGTPDFRDLDSDGNGIPDGQGTETTDDLDGDGIGNWADPDDDGDGLSDVVELQGSPASPPDTDGDGTPDFHDLDSDGDTIADLHEQTVDPDMDGVPAYLDSDSDGDCRGDIVEAGDDDISTPPVDSDGDGTPDFLDVDSDNDGLLDADEDVNCNGVRDDGETSATEEDTDGDGVTDLVEDAAGTDPLSDQDNPQANGDFVFVVPYEEPPTPGDDDLDFATDLQIVDLYVLLDRSGSMAAEIASVKANLQTVLDNLTCPPLGSGDPDDCIPDLASGGGSYTYKDVWPFSNDSDIQADPSAVGAALPGANDDSANPSDNYDEPHLPALWATITGHGSSAIGCSGLASWGPKSDCSGTLAGPGGVGYPCFRPGALPVVLLATDEAPSSTFNCPGETYDGMRDDVIAQAVGVGVKILGILGSGTLPSVATDLEELADGTGATDVGGAPLVVSGADASAAGAIEDAIKTLANAVPIDISAVPVDDPGDAVDAVTEFVDHLETLQLGSPECTDGLTVQDSDGDGFEDLFVGVLPGTPVCWKVVARTNTSVEPTEDPQLFRATVDVYGDGVTLLDTRDVYFLVPPDLEGPGID